MPPKRIMPIHLSRHAVRRWRERVGNDRVISIQGHMRRAISSAIKRGVLVDKQGAVTINVTPDGVKAVVAPSARGGWEVVTVWVEEKREEVKWEAHSTK